MLFMSQVNRQVTNVTELPAYADAELRLQLPVPSNTCCFCLFSISVGLSFPPALNVDISLHALISGKGSVHSGFTSGERSVHSDCASRDNYDDHEAE